MLETNWLYLKELATNFTVPYLFRILYKSPTRKNVSNKTSIAVCNEFNSYSKHRSF